MFVWLNFLTDLKPASKKLRSRVHNADIIQSMWIYTNNAFPVTCGERNAKFQQASNFILFK